MRAAIHLDEHCYEFKACRERQTDEVYREKEETREERNGIKTGCLCICATIKRSEVRRKERNCKRGLAKPEGNYKVEREEKRTKRRLKRRLGKQGK